VTLSENRRQVEQWERRALAELRSGDVGRFLRAYHHHDRIRAFDTVDQLYGQLVPDWHDAYRQGLDTVMLAVHRTDVDDLNRQARTALASDGGLRGRPLVLGDREFRVGDRVVMLRNRRALGLLNGMRGSVTAVDGPAGLMVVLLKDGTVVTLPRRYVEAGHVDHGYAMTIHKAQGITVDRAFVLGGEDLYREAGYTALSRARTSTHLYLTTATLHDGLPELTHTSELGQTATKIMERWLRIERGEKLGIDRILPRGGRLG
jgi:ATP-dependent exoDNAse (exonuclease V) alpha subunit